METRGHVSPIIVIGTGRSGTSAVAGMLHYMGVYMGDEFQPADYNNPNGHWEDKEFTQLNRLVLQQDISKEEWWERTIELVDQRQAEAEKRGVVQWGWKIPASTNLLPEYQEMLPNARYVACMRDPEESVKSTMKAYAYTRELAEKIIMKRVEFMEEHMPEEVHKIEFDDLISDPESTFHKLQNYLDIEIVDPERRDTSVGSINLNEKEANVMIAIPNLGEIHSQLVMRLIEWISMQHAGEIRIWTPMNLKPHDFARNHIAKEFIENTDCTHLFFIDADTIPPRHALKSLLRADKPVVTGCTPTMKYDAKTQETKKQYMVMRDGEDVDGDEGIITTWGHGIELVDYTGASCLMIKRDAIDTMDFPLFRFVYDKNGLRTRGEDFYFMDKLKEAGIPVYANYDVTCLHNKDVLL